MIHQHQLLLLIRIYMENKHMIMVQHKLQLLKEIILK